MGLNLIVGVLADADEDYLAMVAADFAVIRELLDLAGARPWAEPELTANDVVEADMWGYSGLHTVRRLAVHLAESGSLPEPLEQGQGAADDPLLTTAYADLPATPPGPFDHLVHHSDCEGYYVPVEFDEVIVDERLAGGYLGSSVRLLAEVRRVASALGLPEDVDPDSEDVYAACTTDRPARGWRRYGVESYVCLRLIHAARHSIATGAAIAFC